MSYNDYGDEPRRSGRRATREPAAAKVQGSTAAATLVFVAIVGFGVGALIGNSGGDDPDTATTVEDADGAPPGSPGTDPSAAPDETAGGDPTEDGSQAPATEVTLEMAESAPAGEELEYRVRTDPEQPGLVLGVERRQPGGDWEPFGEPQLEADLDDDGEHEGHVITGVTGETEWRVVGEINRQRVESNVVTTTITEEEDEGDDENGEDDG